MARPLPSPSRADVWLADLGHQGIGSDGNIRYTRHREHGGKRTCVILSNADFNRSGSELAIVVPITSVAKGIDVHVPIDPPEGGLPTRNFIICEGIRSIARQFLIQKWGQVEDRTMREIALKLNELMALT